MERNTQMTTQKEHGMTDTTYSEITQLISKLEKEFQSLSNLEPTYMLYEPGLHPLVDQLYRNSGKYIQYLIKQLHDVDHKISDVTDYA